jgi:hypothetical protein
MRATVARIVRIIEAPGGTTASLSLPPSGRPSTGGATSVSVRSLEVASRGSKGLLVVLGVAAAAIGTVVLVQHPTSSRPTPAPSPRLRIAATDAPPADPIPIAGQAAGATVRELPVPTVTVAPTPPPAALLNAKAEKGSLSAASARTRPQVGSVLPVPPAARVPEVPEPALSEIPAQQGALATARAPTSASAEAAAKPAASAPWVVDIVEQRKGKGRGSP